MDTNDYKDIAALEPIVVIGSNHAGTRAVVDMLTILGSEPGDVSNSYRENKFFLELHEDILGIPHGQIWKYKIFDVGFAESFKISSESRERVIARLHRELRGHYPDVDGSSWHWKCPSSALCIEFWNEVFPKAYYVHIVRDPYDIAYSLMRRREFHSLRKALRYVEILTSRIEKTKFERYLRVNYEGFPGEIPRIVDFVPGLHGSVAKASEVFKGAQGSRYGWMSEESVRHNLWSNYVALRISLHRLFGI